MPRCQGLSGTRTFIQAARRFLQVEKIYILLATTEMDKVKANVRTVIHLTFFIIFFRSHFLFAFIREKILFLKSVLVFELARLKPCPCFEKEQETSLQGYALAQHPNLEMRSGSPGRTQKNSYSPGLPALQSNDINPDKPTSLALSSSCFPPWALCFFSYLNIIIMWREPLRSCWSHVYIRAD